MTDTTTTTGDKAGKDDDGAGQGAAAEGAKSDAGSTDWKAEARKWEDRAKANVSAAEELQQLKDAEKTEVQKAQERAAQLEKELGSERTARLRTEVAAAKGVPASSVTGTTREEMEAAADDLLAWRGGSDSSRDTGGGFGSGASTTDSGLSGREKAAAALRRLRK